MQINVIIDNEPMTPEALARHQRINWASWPSITGYYIRSDYNPPQTQVGIDDGGLATGAYVYRYGEAVTANSPRINARLPAVRLRAICRRC